MLYYLPHRPIKNEAFRLFFQTHNVTNGVLTSQTNFAGATKISKDAAAKATSTNNITAIAGFPSGGYYIDLTASEMNADKILIQIQGDATNISQPCIVIHTTTLSAGSITNPDFLNLGTTKLGVKHFNYLQFRDATLSIYYVTDSRTSVVYYNTQVEYDNVKTYLNTFSFMLTVRDYKFNKDKISAIELKDSTFQANIWFYNASAGILGFSFSESDYLIFKNNVSLLNF